MFPAGWQRGLLWIPALYLAFMGALFYGRSLSAQARGMDAEIQRALDAGDKARAERDIPAFQKANDELDRLTDRLRTVQTASFALAGGIGIGLLLFIWATWQVTQRAVSRWETFARWGALLIPLLSILMIASQRSIGIQIVHKLTSIAISVGHHHALHKIAAFSGSRDVAERVDWLYRSFYRFVLLMIVVPISGALQQGPNWLKGAYEEILLGVAGLFVTALAFTLWKLRTRLLTVSAVLAAAEAGDFEDEAWQEDER